GNAVRLFSGLPDCGSSRVGSLDGEDLSRDRADAAGGGRVLAVRSQPGQHVSELVDVGRLREVVVEADFAALPARFLVGPTGDRGQEDPGGSRISTQESGQLEAAQYRHAEVDQANVGGELERQR